MITVAILINGEPILVRSARNLGTEDGETYSYKVDTGDIITHKREDGAVVLAHMLLDTIHEV